MKIRVIFTMLFIFTPVTYVMADNGPSQDSGVKIETTTSPNASVQLSPNVSVGGQATTVFTGGTDSSSGKTIPAPTTGSSSSTSYGVGVTISTP